MMVFISSFIKDFSSKAAEVLRELTQGKQGFVNLKKASSEELTKKGKLCRNNETILYTDASLWGLGAVLLQKDPERKEQ